jgi:hypothetical protein
MHDMAIEERTRLQLELEKKEQEQKLIDYELEKGLLISLLISHTSSLRFSSLLRLFSFCFVRYVLSFSSCLFALSRSHSFIRSPLFIICSHSFSSHSFSLFLIISYFSYVFRFPFNSTQQRITAWRRNKRWNIKILYTRMNSINSNSMLLWKTIIAKLL